MKVLVISHNPMSTYNNMGKTLCSLFNNFKKDELCQLYIYPSIPDVEMCNSYYRITDRDVLKSYYRLNVKGKEISVDTNQHIACEEPGFFYQNVNGHTPIKILLRDSLWKYAKWFNKNLEKWIDKEKPTHIFIAPGNGKFIYEIALFISKKYALPIVTYICDDYYFLNQDTSFWGRIAKQKLKKTIEKIIKNSSHTLYICDMLKEAYVSKLGGKAITIMTGNSMDISIPKDIKNPKSITYLGNLWYDRNVSLAEIGRTLDEINEEFNENYMLKIYSDIKDKRLVEVFENISSIKICGYVSGEAFKRVFNSAEILLHVEAFDEKNRDAVKFSISTKIADLLGSGISIFAYGPEDIASIKYLQENGASVVCTEKKCLKKKILQILNDKELRQKNISKALKLAEMNHNAERVSSEVYSLFEGINNG